MENSFLLGASTVTVLCAATCGGGRQTLKINKQGWQCRVLLMENGLRSELLEEVLHNTMLPDVATSFVTC